MAEKKELSNTEKKLFEAIEKNDVVLLKTLLAEVKNVNIIDENSMTPLQHAAYKGNKEIVQILLDQVIVYFCQYFIPYGLKFKCSRCNLPGYDF